MTKLSAVEHSIPSTELMQLQAFDKHEFLIAISDSESGLKAFIAIHNSSLGPTHGGTRMKAYESEADAITDVLELSKAMSYKSAMAGLPYGGAKGVIMASAAVANRKAQLDAYAKRVSQLNGLFRTGTDVGLTDEDTKKMAESCPFILGTKHANASGLNTSTSAARGVFYALLAAAEHKYGSANLSSKVVGVKGVGKLGSELVRLLHEKGAKVIAADIDPQAVNRIAAEFPGINIVDAKDIHKQEMNIYAPCALGHEFTPEVIDELACDIVVGGANNQLPNDMAGDMLFSKGVLYAPDYIANAGGLIFVSEDLEEDEFNPQRIETRLRNIQTTLLEVFMRSKNENLPANKVADAIAVERISGSGARK